MPWRSQLSTRRVRLVTGWILFAFVAMHLLNHALGLISIGAMERGRGWFNLVWGNLVGTLLFYGSLAVHFALALQALYRRRTLRMPAREALHLVLGIGLPLLLIPHIVALRIAPISTGHFLDYGRVVHSLWNNPVAGWRQVAALLVAWTHGCLGLW
ncbi:MAG: adenylate/guanylate cyclase domain-containing protein, partial [Hyphomicrobiales bacterium]